MLKRFVLNRRKPDLSAEEFGRHWRESHGPLLTGLPDRLCGYRLAGRTQDNARGREALTQLGLNPLMAEAFRDRTIVA